MRATYRLQLSPQLDFAAVRALVPYLRDLGVSHLYLSPSLQARSGSTHGYDVVDPTRVSETLGGEEGLRALRAEGLEILLDIVPNHMGIGEENRWWSDAQLRAKYFDYDPADGWYRRFFDIDDLAALRQEDPDVFEATHAKVLELLSDGVVYGVRVDHPDGLADPAGYLRRLRERGVEHVWVEKILERDEEPRDWPVDGTVGYEFLGDVTALCVDAAGEAALSDLYAQLTGETRTFEAVAIEAQVQQATTTFAREVARLRNLLESVPPTQLADALAALPIYRTYVEPWSGRVEDADRRALEAGGIDGRLRAVLLLRERGHDEFVTRFQQTSPPVTAKGVEDTAFYRYVRLLALNEVGCDPGRFGMSIDEFHARNLRRARRFPRGLLVTQTHDTKRSGDVRARLCVLASIPGEWRERVLRWRELGGELRTRTHPPIPDAAEEHLIHQTLLGAWPIEPERLEAYVEKALREAKRNTSWVDQDLEYEAKVKRFAVGLTRHEPFLSDFVPFQERIAALGERIALGQQLLKLTSPGVPDVYQGDELVALSLVDPDNRRPVDWARRHELLARLRGGARPRDADERKLHLIWRALELRARRPECFDAASYEPLAASAGVCAYLRGGAVLVVAAVRPFAEPEVELPPGDWSEVLDLTSYGVALYERP